MGENLGKDVVWLRKWGRNIWRGRILYEIEDSYILYIKG